MAGTDSACTCALLICAGATGAEAFALARCARDHGQRKAHSREPRHRHPFGGPAFLLSRGMGADSCAGISRARCLRRGWADHSLEFSVADAGVEDCACACDREHSGAETCGVHAADSTRVRGNLPGNRLAGGRGEHRDGRRFDGRGAGEASGRRQDCLHRLDRSGARNPQRDRAEPQEVVVRTRRQVAVHRV